MSGHSKWSQIKHKKANTDAKKGKAFTKLVKEIAVAARMGGGDPDGNPRLRLAIDKAKEVNMPQDNIKRAVMKGTGELPGVVYEEMRYEGYGPGGVAVLIDVLSDNKNRTVSDLRNIIAKNGGNMGESGSVAWIFENRGYILVDKTKTTEDTLMGVALDAGAIDMKNDPSEDSFEIITEPSDMQKVKDAVAGQGIEIAHAEVTMLPKNYVPVDAKTARQVNNLIEAIDDHDDVQNVYTNADFPDEAEA